jgi:RNA polymerase sigma factor (sigma-70 family)
MPEFKSKTDEQLMELLQRGESDALKELYERHSSKVWTYLTKKVSREEVDDLFQDIFVKIVEKKNNWNGQPFVLWLFVIARHMVIDFYRDTKRDRNALGRIMMSSDEENDIVIEDIVANLPPETSKILIEYFKEGWTYTELAQKYKVNEVSLRKRLSRALGILRKDHQ